MIFWAPASSPVSTSALIWFFCSSVNERRPGQGGDALDRVVERLAELDRRRFMSCAHRRRDMSSIGFGRLVEDVVALAGLVPDVRERQQQVLARLDRLVVDTGLFISDSARSSTCLAVTLAPPPVDFNTAVRLRGHLLRLR